MKYFCKWAIIAVIFSGCVRQPRLPENSVFNVTSVLNDTVWYGTGKVLRLKKREQNPNDVREFNLLVYTDIDVPGLGDEPNPNTENGCVDFECTRTQALAIFNIPLRKGRSKVSKLDKRRHFANEYASHSYIGNSGGLLNEYVYSGLKPGWIKVTKFDRVSGIVEGRFAISFSQNMKRDVLPLRNHMGKTARFTNGLFRIKITDVVLK